jgi:hypothetical protein
MAEVMMTTPTKAAMEGRCCFKGEEKKS